MRITVNRLQHMSTAMEPELTLKQPIRQGAAWNAAFLIPGAMAYEDWLAYHFNLFHAKPQPERTELNEYVEMPANRPVED